MLYSLLYTPVTADFPQQLQDVVFVDSYIDAMDDLQVHFTTILGLLTVETLDKGGHSVDTCIVSRDAKVICSLQSLLTHRLGKPCSDCMKRLPFDLSMNFLGLALD